MANKIQIWLSRNLLGIDPEAVESSIVNRQSEIGEQRSVGISDTAGMMRLLNLAADGQVNVNDHTIETIPAVIRAVNIVCGALAKLPLTVGSQAQDGTIKLRPNHPVAQVCNLSPDGINTPYRFWWQMWANAYLSGGAGAEIIRNANGRPVALRLMRFGASPYQVWPDDPMRYWDNETGRLYDAADVLYIPGLLVRDGHTTCTLSQMFKNDFGEQLAQTLLSMTLFKQGVYPAAVYGYQGTKSSMKGDEETSLEISRYFGGLDKAGRVLPIANMDKFLQLKQHSFVDSQMIEQRKWGLNSIALMFGIPSDMLGSNEKQSYSYSEQSAKQFIMYTLDPQLTQRDQEVKMKLLTTAEMSSMIVETHVNEAMWMVPKDRAEYWWKKFQMGAINADEIRAYDNEAPIPDGSGKNFYVQAQLIPTNQIADFWAAKNGQETGTPPAAQRTAEPTGKKLNGHHVEN